MQTKVNSTMWYCTVGMLCETEFLTAMTLKITVFLAVAQSNLVNIFQATRRQIPDISDLKDIYVSV
jgi:hypothetical protein